MSLANVPDTDLRSTSLRGRRSQVSRVWSRWLHMTRQQGLSPVLRFAQCKARCIWGDQGLVLIVLVEFYAGRAAMHVWIEKRSRAIVLLKQMRRSSRRWLRLHLQDIRHTYRHVYGILRKLLSKLWSINVRRNTSRQIMIWRPDSSILLRMLHFNGFFKYLIKFKLSEFIREKLL